MRALLVYFLFSMAVVQAHGMPEPVASKLAELDVVLQGSAVRVIAFDEARHFPFRRLPVRLSGVARISDRWGVSLEYPEKQSLILVDAQGVLMRKFSGAGEVREKVVDSADSTTAVLLKNLFEFNQEALARLFHAEWEEGGDAETWSIHLKGRESADLDLDSVVLRGRGAQLLETEIRFSAERWIVITPQSEPSVQSFAADELKRYFRNQAD